MLVDAGLIVGGLVLLTLGGEALVRGAGSLAKRLGISPLVVGLTVVSIATSAPELAVTVGAALTGEADLAVGNVIGSNISNVLLILALGALIAPLIVTKQIIARDLVVMAGFSVLMLAVSLDERVSRLDGALLLGLLIAVMTMAVANGRSEPTAQVDADEPASVQVSLLLVGVGIGALMAGAKLLVDGAVSITTALGVSQMVVGLTVVSIGTSLPELAATIVAVRRGQVQLAIGNVAGSNIANIGLVLGVPAMVTPNGINVASSARSFDLPIMIASAVLLVAICYTDRRIVAWEGLVMLGLYATYVTWLVLASSQHSALAGFSWIVMWFVLPLVGLGTAAAVAHQLHHDTRRRARDAVASPNPEG